MLSSLQNTLAPSPSVLKSTHGSFSQWPPVHSSHITSALFTNISCIHFESLNINSFRDLLGWDLHSAFRMLVLWPRLHCRSWCLIPMCCLYTRSFNCDPYPIHVFTLGIPSETSHMRCCHLAPPHVLPPENNVTCADKTSQAHLKNLLIWDKKMTATPV